MVFKGVTFTLPLDLTAPTSGSIATPPASVSRVVQRNVACSPAMTVAGSHVKEMIFGMGSLEIRMSAKAVPSHSTLSNASSFSL